MNPWSGAMARMVSSSLWPGGLASKHIVRHCCWNTQLSLVEWRTDARFYQARLWVRGKYLVFDGFCQWHGELEQYLVKCFNFTSPSHGSTDFFGSCLTELFETTGLDILSMEMPTIEAVTQFHRHCTALDALNLDSVSVSPTELVLCHSTFSNVRKPWVSYILIKGSLVANFRYTNFWVAWQE